MHEHGMMLSVVSQVLRIADGPVLKIRLRSGELSGLGADHLIEHFRLAALGTPLENTEVEIVEGDGLGVVLESIDIEEA